MPIYHHPQIEMLVLRVQLLLKYRLPMALKAVQLKWHQQHDLLFPMEAEH